jgi:hypothetical protein
LTKCPLPPFGHPLPTLRVGRGQFICDSPATERGASRPVSRVLSVPRNRTTIHLERPLPDASCNQPGPRAGNALDTLRWPCGPYSVLLPVGFALPLALPSARCALTAPFHPCRAKPGGLFSVALSLGSPPPDVIRHRFPAEPGLSSTASFRSLRQRSSGRLAICR